MEPGKRAGNVLRASRETGEASRANRSSKTGRGDQLPAVLLNPSNFGIVAMLPCAVEPRARDEGCARNERHEPGDTG